MSAFFGITGLVELPSVSQWDPKTGDTLQRRYRGTRGECEIASLVVRADRKRYSIEQPDYDGFAILSVFQSAEDGADPAVPLSSEWELIGEDLEKSIWVHPKWLSIASKLRDGKDGESWWVAYFRGQIEALARGESKFTDREGTEFALSRADIISDVDAIAGLNSTQEKNLGQLIDDLCDGVESWPISRYVLRHTEIVAANTTIRLSYANVGKIFSTAKLTRTEDIDQVILGTLPNGWWLKRTPTLRASGSSKYQITQEWWHADDYSRFLYDLA